MTTPDGITHYDLATAEADLPLWYGAPHRSIVICGHPRSGTTLLGEILRDFGDLGIALEYFHRGFRPYLQERFGAKDLDAYATTVHARRTSQSGTFAVKLFWRDVEELAHEVDPANQPDWGQRPVAQTTAEDYRRIWSLVAPLFPNPVFIHVRRQDSLRQAISAVRATQTGLWRSIPGVGRQSGVAEAVYDAGRIRDAMAFRAYCLNHWRGLFDALQVTPYDLTYEALDADLAGVTAKLAQHRGVKALDPPAPRMKRQSDDETEAWVLRYLREESDPEIERPVI